MTGPQEGGSPSLASAQIQESSRPKMPDMVQPWLNGRWHGGHKICCRPIRCKAEEQSRWVRKGEPMTGLWNLVLDTWESKRLLENALTPVDAGSSRTKLLPGRVLFFSIEKCQFITMETPYRTASPPWRCERSQAVFLPNSLAPHSPPWQDAAELLSSILRFNPPPHPNTLSLSSPDGQAPADLWRWSSGVVFCSLIWSFFGSGVRVAFLFNCATFGTSTSDWFHSRLHGLVGEMLDQDCLLSYWKMVHFQANGI